MQNNISIVGGGVTGALLALNLGRSGLDVSLIDRGEPSKAYPNLYQGRTTSLNLASIESLRQSGIWDSIQPHSKAFNEIYVWDAEGSSSIRFHSSDINRKELGVIVHNNVILEAIFKKLINIPTVKIIENEGLTDISTSTDKIVLTTDAEKTIISEILIGADGSLSKVRSISKMPVRTWSYHQIAIVSSVETEKPFNNTAFQIFTDTGPIAFLPTVSGSNEASLIWSTDEVYGKNLLSIEEDDFLEELRLKTENRFGKIKLKEKINSFPLHQLHAKRFAQGRVALVGDSAHTIHPLAGQGLNLGISDVTELTHLILKAQRYGNGLSDLNILQAYSKRRQPDSYKMIGLMEAFKRGFGSESLWMKVGRNFAFNFTNKTEPLKQRLIKEAAGIT